MRLLFDEDLPYTLARHLIGFDCDTVGHLGWRGTKNGELLRRAEKAGFDVLITLDGDMAAEQNMSGRRIAVLVLKPREQGKQPLTELAGRAASTLPSLVPGEIRVLTHNDPR